MNRRKLVYAAILAGGIATVAIGVATAAPFRGCGAHFHGLPGAGFRQGPWGRGIMRRLDLSRAQRDQIFKIFYAAEPVIREKRIALQHDRRELAAATMTAHYDTRLVHVLAGAIGKTQSELMVIRSQAFNRAYQVLTPEQQTRLLRWRQRQDWS
ncbi:MAG: Spy/CpxP family protein refolding chaperone [Gammaproteobacteria bacterium]|nr:Spy/CpxP family protein refolding chaperone [Gammaproteobacteria bacterium]